MYSYVLVCIIINIHQKWLSTNLLQNMYWYVSKCIYTYWACIVMYLVVLVCSFIKCPKNGQITRYKWQSKVEIARCKVMYWFVFICISMYYVCIHMYCYVFICIGQSWVDNALFGLTVSLGCMILHLRRGFRFRWQTRSSSASQEAHVTEPMPQDQGANSSTSTRGPWSGRQIIQYWLSDVLKKKDFAVMTAGTVTESIDMFLSVRKSIQPIQSNTY